LLVDRYDRGVNGESEMLLAFLDRQRQHVLGILDGLSDDQLRSPVLPSGWSCLGMLRHLTVAVEHYWFQCIINGEALAALNGTEVAGGDWLINVDTSGAEMLDAYREEILLSNEVIRTTSLDASPRQIDPGLGDWEIPNLRFVMLHLIEETACHAGHLDAAREILDGRQWLVL